MCAMKTIILAAGRSRRLKPVADKNFLRFAGKNLLEHQLEMMQQTGLEDFILVAGKHNLEQTQKLAEKFQAKVVEQKDLDQGMAGAILAAEPEVNGEPVLIVNGGDVLGQSAYEKITQTGDADAYILAYKVDSYFPGGYLELDGNRITNIIEKPGEGNEPSDCINLVLHLHKDSNKLFETLKATNSESDDIYEVALAKLMKEQNIEAVHYDGPWRPIKFPWHILDLMEFSFTMMGSRIDESAEIADSAIIKGDVVIEAGVKVFDNAVIQGPAYIGKNSVVATNALVRNSMLGENCVVGFGTEIARAFIGDDCWFHSNYIGDTVMGNNNSFGAGAVCANLRLDEKEIKESGRNKLGPIFGDNIRVGVNTSIMPGIKIGSNTMITSGLVIAEDIEEGKFVSGKTELTIKENTAKLDQSSREEMKDKLK